jgi:hypothetical protein
MNTPRTERPTPSAVKALRCHGKGCGEERSRPARDGQHIGDTEGGKGLRQHSAVCRGGFGVGINGAFIGHQLGPDALPVDGPDLLAGDLSIGQSLKRRTVLDIDAPLAVAVKTDGLGADVQRSGNFCWPTAKFNGAGHLVQNWLDLIGIHVENSTTVEDDLSTVVVAQLLIDF